jgi:hypothetical protein
MEKYPDEENQIHSLVVAELLALIDHKLRGIQQLIIAVKDLAEDSFITDSLDSVMDGTRELQAIYQGFLKLRRSEEEMVEIGAFVKDECHLSSGCSGRILVDREKLVFVFNTIREFGGKKCKVTSLSSKIGCFIKFFSPTFHRVSYDDFDSVPMSIHLLSLYAAKRITEKIGGSFNIEGDTITIELSYCDPLGRDPQGKEVAL